MVDVILNLPVSLSFEVLTQAVTKMSLEDKNRLLEMLEEQIATEEEQRFEQDPTIRAELEQSRAESRAKDYVSYFPVEWFSVDHN